MGHISEGLVKLMTEKKIMHDLRDLNQMKKILIVNMFHIVKDVGL